MPKCLVAEVSGNRLITSILLDIDNFFNNSVVIVEKVINIYQNSRSQTAMEPVCQFPNCRPEIRRQSS